MLAALVYTQSNCEHEVNNSYGAGLTLINRGMHAANIRGGVYRFGVWTDQGWTRKELDVSAFPFRREALMHPEPNIYFAAAILNVFSQQCPHIDRAFDSAPHRHAVSHFIWGDRVGDTGPEDRILTARRRLLTQPRTPESWHGGAPRNLVREPTRWLSADCDQRPGRAARPRPTPASRHRLRFGVR